MQRREALKLVACGAGSLAFQPTFASAETRVPIIDAHIHLFDPTRPGGVPWPPPDDAVLYKTSSPERYVALAAPLGIVGAIAIEASPLASDNQWLLNVAAKHPVIVGIIGDLVPGASDYSAALERLHANPLFLGFRYGNLWNRDLSSDFKKPGFEEGLRALERAGLVFESANPDGPLIHAILRVAERFPDLRIVVDHLPHAVAPQEPSAQKQYWADLHRLAQNKNVFIKLSEIPVLQKGLVVTETDFYKPRLDAIWTLFGEDHILFGSDWPNSDHVAPIQQTLSIVRAFIAPKGRAVAEKFFWKNSIAAYRWHRRLPDQPQV